MGSLRCRVQELCTSWIVSCLLPRIKNLTGKRVLCVHKLKLVNVVKEGFIKTWVCCVMWLLFYLLGNTRKAVYSINCKNLIVSFPLELKRNTEMSFQNTVFWNDNFILWNTNFHHYVSLAIRVHVEILQRNSQQDMQRSLHALLYFLVSELFANRFVEKDNFVLGIFSVVLWMTSKWKAEIKPVLTKGVSPSRNFMFVCFNTFSSPVFVSAGEDSDKSKLQREILTKKLLHNNMKQMWEGSHHIRKWGFKLLQIASENWIDSRAYHLTEDSSYIAGDIGQQLKLQP